MSGDVVCVKCIVLDSDYSNRAVAEELRVLLVACPWPVSVRWDDGVREGRFSSHSTVEDMRGVLRSIRSGVL